MSMAQKLVEDLKVQDAFVIPVFGVYILPNLL